MARTDDLTEDYQAIGAVWSHPLIRPINLIPSFVRPPGARRPERTDPTTILERIGRCKVISARPLPPIESK